MNNFKWQYLVGECKMDFPIVTWIPSFENSFYFTYTTVSLRWTWSIAYPQGRSSVIFALHQLLRCRRAKKDFSHAQEPTGNVRSSFKITWTYGYKSGSAQEIGSVSVVTNSKMKRIHFTTLLSTSCWRSFGYGESFMYSVFMSLTISDLHYLQGLVPDNCRRKRLSVLGEIANLDVIYDQWMEESS